MNKKVKIILLISIALNLLFVSFHLGLITGYIKPPRLNRIEMMQRKEQEIISILPSTKQDIAKETFAKLKNIRKEKYKSMRKQIDIIEKIATEKTFDKEAFLNEFTKLNYTSNLMREKSNFEIGEFLSKLNQEERKNLAEKIKKEINHFNKK